MISNHGHLIEIDETQRRLVIHRIYADGRKDLFTSVELPAKSATPAKDQVTRFCQMLGENLLLDSPAARKLLGL